MSEMEVETPVEAEVDPAAGDGVAATTPLEGAGPEPAASAWTGPSEEDWFALQQGYGQMAQFLQQLTAPPEREPDEWDPLADNAEQDLFGRIDQRLDSRLDRIERMLDRQDHEFAVSTREEIFDSFKDLGVPDPETGELGFDRELAHSFANAALPEAQAKYGNHPYAIQAALRAGAERATEIAKQQREIGKKAYIAEMEALKNAPTPVPTNQATGTEIAPQIEDPVQLARYKSQRFLQGIAS